jgi:hypothetical protein
MTWKSFSTGIVVSGQWSVVSGQWSVVSKENDELIRGFRRCFLFSKIENPKSKIVVQQLPISLFSSPHRAV